MKNPFSSLAARTLVLGLLAGSALVLVPACGASNAKPARCSRSNCSGCCDADGVCQVGNTAEACGLDAVTCVACTGGQTCSAAGACTASGGGGGTDGGTNCSPSNCTGCCQDNKCVSGALVTACGKSGQVCTACTGGQDCSQGMCQAAQTCNGCKDLVGNCQPGTAVAACGAAGAQCKTCSSGQSCINGACVGCNGTSCPDGCCDGTTCVTGTAQGISKCGAAGQACTACVQGATCNLGAQGGSCTGGAGGGGGGMGGGMGGGLGGGFGGGGGGLPGLDGGFCLGCTDPLTGACIDVTTPDQCGAGGGQCFSCVQAGYTTCDSQSLMCLFGGLLGGAGSPDLCCGN